MKRSTPRAVRTVLRPAFVVSLVLATARCEASSPIGTDEDEPAIGVATTTASFNATVGGGNPANVDVAVTNSGGGALTGLNASVAYGSGQLTGWLTATVGAAAPATLTLSATTGSLPAGTYTAQVSLNASDAANDPVQIAATFTVTTVVTPPAAPTALIATATGTTQIGLSWTDNANNETGFEIDRCSGASCTNFAQVGTVGANVVAYQSTALNASTTYRFRVRATNGAGDSSDSNIASATTGAAPSPPTAPSNLTATAASTTQINLTWTDNANNESGFEIDRCTGAACTNFVQVGTVGANVIGYQSTGLTASTTYRFRVRATNGDGDSPNSNIASVATNAPPTSPAAPSNLSAIAASSTQINLTWTDNANNETGFEIDRCQGAACTDFFPVGTVGANVVAYQSTGLSQSTTYRFRVRATNGAGVSADSNIASAATTVGSAIGPTGLIATAASTTQVNLSWTDNSSNETGFEIDRCSGAACTNFAQIATVGSNVTVYQSTGLSPSTTYRFRVRATNAAGDSPDSNIASATTQSAIVEQTFLATADNLLLYNSSNNSADLAFPNGENSVGFSYFYNQLGWFGTIGGASLIYFDIGSVIAGRTILEAQLILYPYVFQGDASRNNVYRVSAVASFWSAAVTWNQWANNMNRYITGEVNFNPTQVNLPQTINITQIVQSWANSTFVNYGVQVWEPFPLDPGYSSLQTMSYESLQVYTNTSRRPALYIRYQ